MYKGHVATIRMDRSLLIGETAEDTQFDGIVLDYDEQEGNLLLALQTGELTEISLNAIYRCEIQMKESGVWCTGTVVDRCCSGAGKIVNIKIENGFYKINIK